MRLASSGSPEALSGRGVGLIHLRKTMPYGWGGGWSILTIVSSSPISEVHAGFPSCASSPLWRSMLSSLFRFMDLQFGILVISGLEGITTIRHQRYRRDTYPRFWMLPRPLPQSGISYSFEELATVVFAALSISGKDCETNAL